MNAGHLLLGNLNMIRAGDTQKKTPRKRGLGRESAAGLWPQHTDNSLFSYFNFVA